ncbi:MAG: YbjN domain-containing protein [Elainellaceae cyanobacterium]
MPCPTSESITNSITQFIQDQTTDSLKQITAATDPLFQDIAQTFQDLFTNALSDIESDDPDFGEHSDDSGSAPLIDAVTEFLDIEEWPYAQIPEVSANAIALRLAFRGEQGQWPCYCKINQEQQTVCFYSISPMTAESEHYGAIAHFLTRANYGMILGNFELDFRDGEIRYKTSIDVEGDRLSHALIKQLVYTNVLTMDQYLPGIIAVLEQGMEPKEAIAQIEAPGDRP